MKCINGIGGGNMYKLWSKEGIPTDLAWQEIAKPIEELIGCKLIAFDPNFVFRMKDGSQANVPFMFIIELNEMLTIDSVQDRKDLLNRKEEV